MMLFSLRSTITHVLLILGAMALMFLIAWMALQQSGARIDWLAHARGATPYLTCWRALVYSLLITGWTTALRLRPALEDQHRLKRLGLIGFGSIILVELSRV
ncbi:hypothetical protein [Pseudomonas sp. NFX224]|uniref:hypothetical protein n=1 Tax=Pseudomonas sp. NFX224 TaxID=3402862 RepID=UPI003AFA145E